MADIAYKRIRLRPWRAGDAARLIETARCPHVQQWLRDWRDVADWAAPWIAGQGPRHTKGDPIQDFMSWAITVPPSDTPIGVINLGGDEMDHQGLSLGYFLHEEAQRQGYATEAVQGLCAYAFGRWDVPEIWANAREDNLRSRAVLERAGFTYLETRLTELPEYDEPMPCAWYVIKR